MWQFLRPEIRPAHRNCSEASNVFDSDLSERLKAFVRTGEFFWARHLVSSLLAPWLPYINTTEDFFAYGSDWVWRLSHGRDKFKPVTQATPRIDYERYDWFKFEKTTDLRCAAKQLISM
ncbi:hypothetical protein N7501_003070 [Penicillium viridicatum]|nr:hypothetical protein N7501_003070 [Penicillium viridicatum]